MESFIKLLTEYGVGAIAIGVVLYVYWRQEQRTEQREDKLFEIIDNYRKVIQELTEKLQSFHASSAVAFQKIREEHDRIIEGIEKIKEESYRK